MNIFIRKKYQRIDMDIIDYLDLKQKKSIFLYGRSGCGKTHTLNELIEYVLTPSTLKIIEVYNEKADYFFVTFGSSTGPTTEAVSLLKDQGLNFGIVSFS